MNSGDGLTSRYVGYRITNPGPTAISDDGSNGPDNTPSDKEAKLTIPVDAAPDYRIELTDNRTLA